MKHDLNKVINPERESQCDSILSFMMNKGSITALEAVQNMNCWRLAARIYDLRKYGWEIKTVMIGTKTKYARYYLERKKSEVVK